MTRYSRTASSPCSASRPSSKREMTSLSKSTVREAASVSSRWTTLLSSEERVRVTSPRCTRPSTLAVTEGLLTPVSEASLDTVHPSLESIITRYM